MATATDIPPWPLLQLLIGRRSADFSYDVPRGGLASDPVEIPYEWISAPLTRRPTRVINHAEVSQAGGIEARADSTTSINQYGLLSNSITLNTAVDADTIDLAHHLVTFYSTPRPRQPVVRLNLLRREDEECLRILGVTIASRVRITGAPAEWPAGAVSFVVEGISHTIGAEERVVEWMTSAPIGSVAGTPGPWFRWDSSSWGGSDIRPF